MARRIFAAITGTKHYFGTSFLKPGMLIHLKKESDNPYDQEAIMAVVTPIGKIGYVANSTYTVPKGCRSAGRIYDTFGEQVACVARFVVHDVVIVEIMPGARELYMVYLESDGYKANDQPGEFPRCNSFLNKFRE